MTKEDNKLANKTFFSIIANYVTIVLIVYINSLIYNLINVNLYEVNIIVEILTLPQLKQWDSCFYDRYIVTRTLVLHSLHKRRLYCSVQPIPTVFFI